MQRRRFGQILIDDGRIDPGQRDEALLKQKTTMGHRKIGDILSRLGAITVGDITAVLAVQYEMPVVELSKRVVPDHVRDLVPGHVATYYRVVPVEEGDDGLLLAVEDPTNRAHHDAVATLVGRKVKFALATPDELSLAIGKYYPGDGKA